MKNYISKINDRNLQRKRESGFTSYALFSVIIIILYKIFELYPHIKIRDNTVTIITLLSFTFNIGLSIVTIYGIYQINSGYDSSLRIKKNNTNKLLLDQAVDFSILLIPLISTGFTSINAFVMGENYIYSLFYFVILIAIFLIYITVGKRNVNQTYEIFEGTGKSGTDKDAMSITFYILGILTSLLSLYEIFTYKYRINKLDIMLFGILIYSIPCLLSKIITLKRQENFSTALEHLEYEIHVKDLNDNDIRDRLQKNYYGFLLNDWIIYNLQLMNDFNNNIEKEKSELEIIQNKLSSITVDYNNNDYRTLYLRVYVKKYKIKKLIEDFYNQKLNEIEYFWNDIQIDRNERTELSDLYETLKSAKSKLSNDCFLTV